MASPESFALSQGYTDYVNSSDRKPYVRVRPETDVASTTFAMVLLPTTAADWASRPSVTLLSGDPSRGTGLDVAFEGSQVHLVRTASSGSVTLGTFSLQGRAARASRPRGM